MSGRLVLIEDNADLAFGLRTSLEVEGYDVTVAERGQLGLDLILQSTPDLVVLDLMLPDLSGYEVLRRIRSAKADVPVLVLTARGQEVDKVQGFRLGADDYVVKPVGVLELLARVAALLRRSAPFRNAAATHVIGNLVVDQARRVVRVADQGIDLSPLEFDLLAALARRGGEVASRADLLREVWGYRAAVETRTVDTHIAKLRSKLTGSAPRILTVRKRGYRLG